MGAITGRMSPLGFYVQGQVEDWDKVLGEVVRYRFQPLDPETGRQQAFGWVDLKDPFFTEFTRAGLFYGDAMVALAMRVDTVSIPSSQLKLHLAKRLRDLRLETERESIPKAEAAQVKEDLQAELMRKVVPTIKLYEMVYNTETGRLWFFGKAQGIVQTFMDLFHETFGLYLNPDSPYTVARERFSEELADSLLELEETHFVSIDE